MEERKQKYVDILSNGGFKAFFGDESNKEEVRISSSTSSVATHLAQFSLLKCRGIRRRPGMYHYSREIV